MCGKEIVMGRLLTIEIKSPNRRFDLRGVLSERDLCEDCAEAIKEKVTGWKDASGE